jgi:hypothetical protein
LLTEGQTVERHTTLRSERGAMRGSLPMPEKMTDDIIQLWVINRSIVFKTVLIIPQEDVFLCQSNTANNRSTAFGYAAMRYADSRTDGVITYNTAVGYESLRGSTSPLNNTGQNNTAVGYQSLLANTSGNRNTATGVNSLRNNTTGYNNTAFGFQAMNLNTISYHNTASRLSSSA